MSGGRPWWPAWRCRRVRRAAVTATTTGGGASGDDPAAPTTAAAGPPAAARRRAGAAGEGITLAVNPWTGSAVNANVAKVVLESEVGTPVELVDIDENATWPGLDAGDLDAVLEVWPSGHAEDYETYITGNKGTVVDMGLLGPTPRSGGTCRRSWSTSTRAGHLGGLQGPELAGLFATAESGDLGQFLMGDPSYVSYDEQIIANLELPLKFVVAGSEAALITGDPAGRRRPDAAAAPVLAAALAAVEGRPDRGRSCPEVTEECLASAAAGDGNYACDYPVDELYKAANAG